MAETIHITRDGEVATVRLERGKVNALNETVVRELRGAFAELAGDEAVRAVVLTGTGSFFSFGWDVPELVTWPRARFSEFLSGFVDLYREAFLFRKPLIAAINGHAIAGGCMLANACDERIMVKGRAKISLNEVTFGAALPPGSGEMFAYWVGERKAEELLLSGEMLDAERANEIGWVNHVVEFPELDEAAATRARELAARDLAAYGAIKARLRKPTTQLAQSSAEAISEFVDIWYSESTRAQTRQIRIR